MRGPARGGDTNLLRTVENTGFGIAATSLVLWIGVIYWGRMLPFLGGAF